MISWFKRNRVGLLYVVALLTFLTFWLCELVYISRSEAVLDNAKRCQFYGISSMMVAGEVSLLVMDRSGKITAVDIGGGTTRHVIFVTK